MDLSAFSDLVHHITLLLIEYSATQNCNDKHIALHFVVAPPQTPLGSLQPSPDLLAVFKGPTSNRREGKGEQKGRGREMEGRRGEGMGGLPPQFGSLDPPVIERLSAETRHV